MMFFLGCIHFKLASPRRRFPRILTSSKPSKTNDRPLRVVLVEDGRRGALTGLGIRNWRLARLGAFWALHRFECDDHDDLPRSFGRSPQVALAADRPGAMGGELGKCPALGERRLLLGPFSLQVFWIFWGFLWFSRVVFLNFLRFFTGFRGFFAPAQAKASRHRQPL